LVVGATVSLSVLAVVPSGSVVSGPDPDPESPPLPLPLSSPLPLPLPLSLSALSKSIALALKAEEEACADSLKANPFSTLFTNAWRSSRLVALSIKIAVFRGLPMVFPSPH
jgi:hypothetical protein